MTATVLDPEGNPLEEGVGRLAIKGPTGCRYLDDPRQRDYVENGWNVTGDTYRRDADGYYWYLARSDDMIVSSGYNIGAPEVENALLSHPAVAECAVIGVPCPERGQKVKAFVVLAGCAEPSDALIAELQSHVKAQIAPYKYPREIEFVDALPKTATGKLRRSELRAVNSPPLHLQGRGPSDAGGGAFSSSRRTLAACLHDICDHTVEIVPHVSGLHPDRANPTGRRAEHLSARRRCGFVPRSCASRRPRPPMRFVAEEVELIGTMLVLLAELEAVRPLLERIPETAAPGEVMDLRNSRALSTLKKTHPSPSRLPLALEIAGEELTQTPQSLDRPRGCRPLWPASP